MSAKGMPMMSLKGMLVNAAAAEIDKRMGGTHSMKKMHNNHKVKPTKTSKGSKL